jgi:hypothetical protein
MNVVEQIEDYIAGQSEPKRSEMQRLHRLMLRIAPDCRTWFLDGKNEEGRTVSNPNIGYGIQSMKYAGGKSREFYRIGLSANTTGISIYLIGLADKTYLARTYGKDLGKANISGYCVKFRSLNDIDMGTLEDMIRYGFGIAGENQV